MASTPPWADLVELMPKLTPRYYTISASAARVPRRKRERGVVGGKAERVGSGGLGRGGARVYAPEGTSMRMSATCEAARAERDRERKRALKELQAAEQAELKRNQALGAKERLAYLMKQTDVFTHFMTGDSAGVGASVGFGVGAGVGVGLGHDGIVCWGVRRAVCRTVPGCAPGCGRRRAAAHFF